MKTNYVLTSRCEHKQESANFKQGFLFLKMLLITIFFAGSSFAQNDLRSDQLSNQTPWETQGLNEELVAKRTRTSKSFMFDNNRVKSFISPGSIHYKTNDNNWEEISTQIESNIGNNSQSHPYVAERNAIKTWFPANPFTDYLLMDSKEGSFKEKVTAIQFVDANNQVLSTLPLNSNISASVLNNKIVYSGFHQDLSLEYVLGNDSRKFDLIIHSSNFLNTIPVGAVSISVLEEFVSVGNGSRIEASNNEVLIYKNGVNVFKFDQPVAFDSNSFVDEMFAGNTEVQLSNNTASLKTAFALAWIKSSERQFPIHLDPTVSYYPPNTTYWTGRCTSPTGKSTGFLRISSATTAAWAKFDLSSLPSGATVTQAAYYGYHYTTTSSTKFAEIRALGTVDPVTAAGSAIYGASHNGTLYNSSFTWGGSTYGWHTGVLNSTAQSDIAAAAGSDIGLGFSLVSGSTTFMYHYGHNASSNICYLEVTYFTVPCTATPGANSAVTPTYAICPGTSANIFLASTYSVGGISYQWESSTTSSVGPFSAITGYTDAAVVTPTLNTSTWFRATITCSNSPGITTSSVGLVMVQPTTTNSIPYSTSFEGIIAENKLPNCSWSSPSLGSTALTYTAATTLGRVPRTGSRFASFYYNPAGTKVFYTNGLQLTSGITYSASLWFRTEYYGYTNWSDLSILVGPSQSTTGLMPVASTNGPAVSNIYKLLSGTFTVASTGIYYVAVQASGTSSGAQYLTWDDLKVTKPCTVNSPTLTLNSSTTTICEGDVVNFSASGADTYMWSSGATGSSYSEALTESTTVDVIGTNTASGCSSVESQLIVVNPAPNVFIFTDKNVVCSGSQANLTASGNSTSTYLWSTGSTNMFATVAPTVATTYTVIATNSYGCNKSATQFIDVEDLPTIVVTSSMPTEMCVGETAVLTADGADIFEWLNSSSPVLLAGSPINVSPAVTTVYTVTGTNELGCEGVATIVQTVNECTSLNELNNQLTNLTIYPNPASSEFTIEFNSDSEKTYTLTDLTGRQVLSGKTTDKATTINVANLASGVYYVSIKAANGTEVMKVIKQ